MKSLNYALPMLLIAAGAARAHLKSGSLTPKGGETLTIGSKVNITWEQSQAHDGLYDIYYSKNGGSSWIEFEEGWQAPKTDNATVTYQWTVPANGATTQGKVRVCQLAGGHCTNTAYTLVSSSNFTISSTSSIQAMKSQHPGSLRFDAARGTVEAAFEMASEGKVLVQAFDAQGREVAKVFEGTYGAGSHRLSLFSNALSGARGTLAFRLTAGTQVHNVIWNGSN